MKKGQEDHEKIHRQQQHPPAMERKNIVPTTLKVDMLISIWVAASLSNFIPQPV